MKLRTAAVLIFAALPALSAAADPGGLIAAPGECAQPLSDLVPSQIYGQSAGVAGPPSDHFAPRNVTGRVLSLLPVDLTRAQQTTSSPGVVEDAVETTTDTATSTVERTGETVISVTAPMLDPQDIANDPTSFSEGGNPTGLVTSTGNEAVDTVNKLTGTLGLGRDK